MSEKTLIKWADSTLNFWEGCAKVSDGCKNCYAEARDKRFTGGKLWGKGAARRKSKSAVKDALAMNRKPWISDITGTAYAVSQATAEGKPFEGFHRRRIFSLSLGDIFDREVPVLWFMEAFATIMQCDQCVWILCTKRPEEWRGLLEDSITAIDKGLWTGYYPDHEISTKRTDGVSVSEGRRIGNRPSGTNLAGEEQDGRPAQGRMATDAMRENTGRNPRPAGVSACASVAWQQKDLRLIASVGLDASARRDSREHDHQSQKRSQDGQQARKSGTGKHESANDARLSSAENKALGIEGDAVGRSDNQSEAKGGRIASCDSEGLRNERGERQRHLHRQTVSANQLRNWMGLWLNGTPPAHVIQLTSVENQAMADKRIPELLKIPAACHGLSLEPLLSEVVLPTNIEDEDPAIGAWIGNEFKKIDWIICGCESGSKRRFQDGYAESASSLNEQGKAAGVAVFNKQMPINGNVSHDPNEWPEWARAQQWPKGFE